MDERNARGHHEILSERLLSDLQTIHEYAALLPTIKESVIRLIDEIESIKHDLGVLKVPGKCVRG